MPYKYDIIHSPGKSNIADPLSRLVKSDSEIDESLKRFINQYDKYVGFVSREATPKAI